MIGILTKLYKATNSLGLKFNDDYDNLAEVFQKTDSFDSNLFNKLNSVVFNELPPQNDYEREVFNQFAQMIDEIEMLCTSNKIRKHSIKGDVTMDDEDVKAGEDEETYCSICCF